MHFPSCRPIQDPAGSLPMSGDGKEEPRSPPGSRPASVLQQEENSNSDNVGGATGANAGGGGGAAAGDYSNVAQRTVANIRRLQDNVCGQYVVQSRHVSTSGAAAVGATCQYEQASGAG